jgi:hypothetical protein
MTEATATAIRQTAAAPSAEAEAWVREFAEGWRAPAEAEQLVRHFERVIAPDVRLIQPQIPECFGIAEFRAGFAEPLFTLIPDVHGTVASWAASGDVLYIELTLRGTLGARPIEIHTVDRITLRDGIAVERVAYFDPVPLLGEILKRPRAWPRFARYQVALARYRLSRRSARP